MKKIIKGFIFSSALIAQNVNAEVQKWVELIPQKGYILSLDLQNEKKCSNIWSKRIKEFLKENPHIKDANVILINQKIKVQDCRVEIVETEKAEEIKPILVEQVEKKPEWYLKLFLGSSHVSEKDNDSKKYGQNIGFSIGNQSLLGDKKLLVSVGILRNSSETMDKNDQLGVYRITSNFITAESSLLFPVQKIYAGPKVQILTGEDVSFKEKQDNQKVGLYLGGMISAPLHKNVDVEFDVQQRIDKLDRVNLMSNIGLRFNF